jgi:hypothetical protein
MNDSGYKQTPIEFEEVRKEPVKRPMPPDGPKLILGFHIMRQRAHACACDGIINSGHLTRDYSQSDSDRHGMGKR